MAPLKHGVGRSLSPSVVRPCAWCAARAAAWGPDRAAVTWGALQGCVGRAPSVAWGAAGRTRYACRYRRAHARHVRWAPARRPAAKPAAQPRSQQTPLARPEPGRFLRRRRVPSRASVSATPASGAAEAGVGRSLNPYAPAMRVARRQGRGVGPIRAAVTWGAAATAALGGRRRVRGARRAELGTPAGIAAPTRACAVGARPPPRCPTQPPNHARSRHRWRGPKPGRFLGRRRVPTRASLYQTCQRCC